MRSVCAWRAQCAMLSRCPGRAQGLCNSSVYDCIQSVRRLRPARSLQAVQAATPLRAHVGEHRSVCACTFSSGSVAVRYHGRAGGWGALQALLLHVAVHAQQAGPPLSAPPPFPTLFLPVSAPRLRASRDIGCSLAHGETPVMRACHGGVGASPPNTCSTEILYGGLRLTLTLFGLCCAHRSSHLMGVLPLASFPPHLLFLPVITVNIPSLLQGSVTT